MTATETTDAPWLELRGVAKRYGGRTIIEQIDLQVSGAQTIALIGPSGGGKSTLLRCVNGLNTFDEGEVRVGDHRLRGGIDSGANREAAAEIRRLVGMIFQDFQLFPHLTALGNVIEAPCRVLDKPVAEAREQAKELLAKVGLAERANHYPSQLSGGQKQRVAIARALAMSPKCLLCDEITSALDPELKNEVLAVLESLREEGMTLLMVTHEIGFARRAADRCVVLAGGKIVEDGPSAQVIDAPRHPRTQQFLSRVLG